MAPVMSPDEKKFTYSKPITTYTMRNGKEITVHEDCKAALELIKALAYSGRIQKVEI